WIAFNKWLKKTGEAPEVIDTALVSKSAKALKDYYWNNGWFNVETSYKLDLTDKKTGKVNYFVERGQPYSIDSITKTITSPIADELYEKNISKSFLRQGNQYRNVDLNLERNRITEIYRNSGLYEFEQESIFFDVDTVQNNHKAHIDVLVYDKTIRTEDTIYKEPYKVFKISDVNIITDYNFARKDSVFQDSISYNDYNLYGYSKLKYKPKAITNSVFIHKGDLYRDIDKSLTLKHLNELRVFRYPSIKYVEDPRDSTQSSLIANIFLAPKKKYAITFDVDATHSNIQSFGLSFSTSLIMRNIFRGAETLEVSGTGSIGASKDASDSEDEFFDIREYGANARLYFPRLFLPFNPDKIIPKYMSPKTSISLGTSIQENIGLDKRTFTGGINYNWFPSGSVTNNFDLFNVEFVKNVNTNNYFNVYSNSFNQLNQVAQTLGVVGANQELGIPNQAESFIDDVLNGSFPTISDNDLQTVRSLDERKNRLTQDNLIFTTNFTYVKNKRENLFDNDFSRFRGKIELAGNILSTITKWLGTEENELGEKELFGVGFSQYVKTELDYIKYWDLSRNNIIAFRSFFGVAIPYGNSKTIPFNRSFFGGGSNDNRAWEAYNLGPGVSGGQNDFNEANLKIALNLEYRYKIFGDLNGALFADAGNIWNFLDNVEDEDLKFNGLNSLTDLSIGTGTGFRYDFSFFVLRLDVGFKTYEPYLTDKWFINYNFQNAVYNIGINYPF
ncbi:MAG: BamA/TamA family outer membrane protein, partial [Flavobacteriaceae bacterium]|nr:BamA/TamA family outer membrane protein [Flavobacteriaceae bacterium]